MENYKLLQKLGRGAQGSVYLVEHKEDKANYVLKKVECNDESEANKAFKEAMALQELRHQFVCGYKEFFVTWDREEQAMFVCIVMDYYELGDLAKVLKTKRLKQENIDEMILRKWLGQMVEALVFVHNKKVIHRDLKPSNIFMTKNLSICIGDFGVATVMGDARTRTRTTVGSF
uniref:non-specific serine/threonine protein kinase n=1 Tax=Ciona savignyi TaxID=51511 RepID=H2Z7A6_CIOSA